MEISPPYPQDTSIYPLYAITRLHTHVSVEVYGYSFKTTNGYPDKNQPTENNGFNKQTYKKKETPVKQRFPFLFLALI